MKKIKVKTQKYQFPVIIEEDEDGFFVADCPALTGCHTQGKTLEEAIEIAEKYMKENIVEYGIHFQKK